MSVQEGRMEASRVEDVSADIIKEWGKPFDEIPPIEELRDCLLTRLAEPIPTPRTQAIPVGVEKTGLLSHREQTAFKLDGLRYLILEYEHMGTTEDSWHQVLDGLIKTVMVLLGKGHEIALQIERNCCDPSQSLPDGFRADFLCWLPNGLLAFKGEEKADTGQLEDAKMDLVKKLARPNPQMYNALPYQLCYAAAGGLVQFFSQNLGNRELVDISAKFNIKTHAVERAKVVQCAVNCFRVLHAMHVNLPEEFLSLLWVALNIMIHVGSDIYVTA